MGANVLVVDDDQIFRVLAQEALSAEGYDVAAVGTIARAQNALDRSTPDVVVLDRRLPDGDGLEFLVKLRAENSQGPSVIIVTAYGEIENAVAALRSGAADYLTKPIQPTDLVVKIQKVLEARGLRDRLEIARRNAKPVNLQPHSAAMLEVFEKLQSIAHSPQTPVFFVGPSGAGKQYAAEALHRMSHAAEHDAPLIDVNCAALPNDLIESELFGHEKGAFTDAKGSRRGLIEMADGGTLFLDEISELPLQSQAKLLKFLDSMRFRRLGGEKEISVQLRVIAASNKDIVTHVKDGTFREDLFHRLSVFLITLPALNERVEEIPYLARTFVDYFAARLGKKNVVLSDQAIHTLTHYSFPGNVRELRNIIERAVILATGDTITGRDIVLPGSTASNPTDVFFQIRQGVNDPVPSLAEVDRLYVQKVVDSEGGKRSAAAEKLGISHPTLLKYLRE